jgi:hypothetical protein
MLYREIIAVCSQIHTKHINTLCGQTVEFVNAKPGGTYSDHWAVRLITHSKSYPLQSSVLQIDILTVAVLFGSDIWW